MIFEALGFEVPRFGHLGMILAPDRSKLSKRHGATAVSDFVQQGYLTEALVNFVALLGWAPSDGEEVKPVDKIAEDFRIGEISSSNSIFEYDKLKWMNSHYIKMLDINVLKESLKPYLTKYDLTENVTFLDFIPPKEVRAKMEEADIYLMTSDRKEGWGAVVYTFVPCLLIFAFSFFYAQMQFNPEDVSKSIQQNGGFIQGIRPGKATENYLRKISNRITLFGAIYLSLVAFVPSVAFAWASLDLVNVFSTTGILIVVSCAMEFEKQLQAQMMMKNYKGFLK